MDSSTNGFIVNGGMENHANDINGHEYKVPSGMPLSVFTDRYSRKKKSGDFQTYGERIKEVVRGNFLLEKEERVGQNTDFDRTLELALKGVMPFSGRHLQHGDDNQPYQTMEQYTNCSTACFSFMMFYLLLNGSGVGRDYSADSCRVNWDYMPNFRLVLSGGSCDDGNVGKGAHADFAKARMEFDGSFESLRDAEHKYDSDSEEVRWVRVRDSREGWAEVIAILETAAFHKNHRDNLFISNPNTQAPACKYTRSFCRLFEIIFSPLF